MWGQIHDVTHKEMTVPNDTKYLKDVRQMAKDVLKKTTFCAQEKNQVILAVDEAMANIMEHAVDNNIVSDIHIEIMVIADDTKCEIVIRDSGKEFDPTAVDCDIDIENHVRQGKKHGLGIFLIRQIMDEIKYTFRQGEINELRLVKYMKKG